MIVVVSLLAWMPGPATAGAKVFAWLVILWPTLIAPHGRGRGRAATSRDAIKAKPPRVRLIAWAPGAAFVALVGYGLATVVGKQLE